ncbi:aminotransferase class V-fold PLP-dependent enzyme [Stappia sp. GBMRC 2046]|uniref:Aminotransferase class V-fold PLP-dependent enzyme n=1 Tax=Stappia sediminis TaxID=2692190 RepID=A0A7X3LYG0_9HYPH|nr:DegT/DnrJ/EryC1/StrS aminotransferase family protein [Stappia sediminis]MXN67434.1 aminotransferase class V-fold PLP-dependent enzyme [Stappia sediminis]
MRRWPEFDDEQIEDVVNVLRSGRVNAWTGEKVGEFEAAYAELLGRRHAVAVSNGTVALDLALYALDLKAGDEVVVTPRSFVASASCVAMAGGVPVFADVDQDNQAITADTIQKVLTSKTRAVIVVHLGGWPADMDPIMQLAREHDLVVIEDCAQAHGGEYKGRPVGSLGNISTFSFCQDKIITTGGEGGLLALDDDDWWNKIWSRKDHGKSYDAVHRRDHPPGFRWLHETFGSNYRMMEIQATLGLRQLERLPEWHERRRENAAILMRAFRQVPGLRTPEPPAEIRHAWYRFYTFVRPDVLKPGWTRDAIMQAVLDLGVPCFSGSCSEIYREKAFIDAGFVPPEPLRIAAELGETSLAFLVDPCQGEDDMQHVADCVARVMGEAVDHAAVRGARQPETPAQARTSV